MSQLRSFVRAIAILSSLVIIGCGDGEDEKSPEGNTPQTPAGLEIAGTWESDFGGTEIITDQSWDTVGDDFTSSAEIVSFDNDENVLVSKGPDFMDPTKEVYSRVVWTEVEDGSFYSCTALFGIETQAEAENPPGVADPDDLTTGCGESGFPGPSSPRRDPKNGDARRALARRSVLRQQAPTRTIRPRALLSIGSPTRAASCRSLPEISPVSAPIASPR